ncbi:MAG: hypothetical protein GXY32_02365 [Ruminococcaceae bacterium]|nr:hypothetical protein [Oscillospiraceae bacterium]
MDKTAATDILNRVMSKYGISDLHYYWSGDKALLKSYIRVRPNDLPVYYETKLPQMFSGNVHIIIDCCDGRFIVCQSNLNWLIELLKAEYFDLIEIYLLNEFFDICLCVNHVCEVFEFV